MNGVGVEDLEGVLIFSTTVMLSCSYLWIAICAMPGLCQVSGPTQHKENNLPMTNNKSSISTVHVKYFMAIFSSIIHCKNPPMFEKFQISCEQNYVIRNLTFIIARARGPGQIRNFFVDPTSDLIDFL